MQKRGWQRQMETCTRRQTEGKTHIYTHVRTHTRTQKHTHTLWKTDSGHWVDTQGTEQTNSGHRADQLRTLSRLIQQTDSKYWVNWLRTLSTDSGQWVNTEWTDSGHWVDRTADTSCWPWAGIPEAAWHAPSAAASSPPPQSACGTPPSSSPPLVQRPHARVRQRTAPSSPPADSPPHACAPAASCAASAHSSARCGRPPQTWPASEAHKKTQLHELADYSMSKSSNSLSTCNTPTSTSSCQQQLAGLPWRTVWTVLAAEIKRLKNKQ